MGSLRAEDTTDSRVGTALDPHPVTGTEPITGRWLLTGASGFLGRHARAALNRKAGPGAEVRSLSRFGESEDPRALKADLAELDQVFRAVGEADPDVVLHLAGRTPPADADELFRANVLGLRNLLAALRRLGKPVRLVVAGSAAELDPEPRPYAASKLQATEIALTAGPPIDAIVARVFNPIGPGLPAGQAFGRFARLLASPGLDPVRLEVGDLEGRRDFVDARDVVEALIALALRGHPGRTYQVGTGVSRRVGDGLDRLIALSGRRVEVVPSSELVPPRGVAESRAEIGPILDETGWRPRIAWETSLADLLAWAVATRG